MLVQATERLVLIPAVIKNSTTGYKGVSCHRSKKQFVARARDGGKDVSLGYFDTAEEAATAYAQSEYGRADAAKLLQPRPAPSAAGAEAIRQAEREGLTLATSSSSCSGSSSSSDSKSSNMSQILIHNPIMIEAMLHNLLHTET